MHTYKNCVNFLIIQQLFYIYPYSLLQLFTALYSLYTASYSSLHFLTAYSCILQLNRKGLILFNNLYALNCILKINEHNNKIATWCREKRQSTQMTITIHQSTGEHIQEYLLERYFWHKCIINERHGGWIYDQQATL